MATVKAHIHQFAGPIGVHADDGVVRITVATDGRSRRDERPAGLGQTAEVAYVADVCAHCLSATCERLVGPRWGDECEGEAR